MPVNVLQWPVGIGTFYYCSHSFIKTVSRKNFIPKVRSVISYLYYSLCSLILLTHDDIEINTNSKKSHTYFSCCHWNVNSLFVHNILKVSLLETYNTIHNMMKFVLMKHILILRLNMMTSVSE